MPSRKQAERQLIARVAAHQSWANTTNRTARNAPARDAFLAKFDDLVDPDRQLASEERSRRASNARKAHFTRLALKSAQARHATASRRRALDDLAEATELLAAAAAAMSATAKPQQPLHTVYPGTGDAPAQSHEALPAGGAVR